VRLLVTRPEPEGGRTAALLRQRGHEVLWLPLLRIEPIANVELGPGPWAAVLFTSANAVRVIAAHRRFGELANLAVCAVGRRTQAAAAAAGFTSVMSADGDVNALARLVAAKLPIPAVAGAGPACEQSDGARGPLRRRKLATQRQWRSPPTAQAAKGHGRAHIRLPGPPSGEGAQAAQPELPPPPPTNLPLLYCAGEDRAGDLAAALQLRGLRIEIVIVYRAIGVTALTPDVRAALASGAIDAVLHYSARTAAAFVAAAARAGIEDLSIQARHLCLSTQVAAPLAAAGATAIEVASEPNEQALLALISRT
jgi:uroporphyrinogen-III synthase